MIRSLFLTAALSLAAITAANAHTIWIEPTKDGEVVVRFAEPGNDFETSPGFLDSLSAPQGFMLVTNTPKVVPTTRKKDHFLLTGVKPAQVACVETVFTVRGGRKPVFYARWQPADAGAGTPLLTLDLVPTGKPGEVRAYFRGQPLGDVAATLRTPDQKDQEIKADAEGFIRFKTDQSGQYLLTIPHYREPTALAGFHNGVAYKETSHNTALTWEKTN
jgi:hypothetical protein